MKLTYFIVGRGDDKLEVGFCFIINSDTYIQIISKHEAIILKLKDKPHVFKVIIDNGKSYGCKCLTTTTYRNEI